MASLSKACLLGSITLFTLISPAFSSDGLPQREVLAFYYGWYGNPSVSGRWRHWNNSRSDGHRLVNAKDYPLLGTYDSHDEQIVRRQMTLARDAGVTGFIASWWGPGQFEDAGVPILLRLARQKHFHISLLLEQLHGDDEITREQSAIAQLNYILSQYGSNENWLRNNGHPVVFVYGRALKALSPAIWTNVIDTVRNNTSFGISLICDTFSGNYPTVFDGASTYNLTSVIHGMSSVEVKNWAHSAFRHDIQNTGTGKIKTLTVIPGFNDSALGLPEPRPITDRQSGSVYKALWEEAINAGPQFILITTWNEWHEGTEIEPSREYKSLYLNLTKHYSAAFLGNPPI